MAQITAAPGSGGRRRSALLGERPGQRQEVWGPGYGKETHYLPAYMAQLRRKLETHPERPAHLITEPGLGYRLDP